MAVAIINNDVTGFIHEKLVGDLLKECAKMYNFNHPNVLSMLGVCLDGGPAPLIVMPFMANGSLKSYLKKGREYLQVEPDVFTDVKTVSSGNGLLISIEPPYDDPHITHLHPKMWYIKAMNISTSV